MSDTSPPAVPATSEPMPKQSRSAQDKIIGAYITDAKKFLKVASEDEQIRPILEAHGYDAGEFTTAANLDDLTGTGGDQDTALGDAIEDTAERDAAHAALKTFMKELKGTARGALRGKPGLLAKLEL